MSENVTIVSEPPDPGLWKLLPRLLYAHNPFYLVSAMLVLLGAPLVFPPGDDSRLLLAFLAGYTGLLAAAGVLVIRWGKIWQDARTILLVVVLLFLAMSASFDQEAIERPRAGAAMLLAGLAFAVACSEAVLRAARLRLRWGYRGPYHALLALFFAAPIALAEGLRVGDRGLRGALLAWGVLAFPALAAAISLALVPAIRRGREYAERNGTPWGWPFFPWSLFFILAVGVAGRAYWLTQAFLPAAPRESAFGLHFLAPIVLAAGILLLEGGLVSGSRALVRVALAAPAAALLASLHLGPAGFARADLFAVVGPPPLLAAWGAAGFYAWAMARRVRAGEAGLVAALALAAVVGGGGLTVDPRPLPLLVLAGVAVVQAVRLRSSARVLAAWLAALVALSVELHAGADLVARVGYAGALVVGLAFRDPFARWIRSAAAYPAAAAFAVALFPGDPSSLATAALLFALVPCTWAATRDAHWFRALVLDCGALAIYAGAAAHGFLSGTSGRGGVLLFWGAVSFVVAVLTTTAKAGGLGRAVERVRALANLSG